MAAIDKTYFKTWDQYQEVLDFCSKYEDGVIDEYGNKFRPSEFVLDWTKSDFIESISNQRMRYTEYYSNPDNLKKDKEWFDEMGEPDWEPEPVENIGECALWNTPIYFDVWLIRNCNIDFIVSRLRQQYSDFDDIQNHCSEYDIPRFKGSHRYKVEFKESDIRFKSSDLIWMIQIKEEPSDIKFSGFSYNEEEGRWYASQECRGFSSNTCYLKGIFSYRKLSRYIKKWDLPKGMVLRIYVYHPKIDFYIKFLDVRII
jgi:hypothetical protein